jgi:hypothetical protein
MPAETVQIQASETTTSELDAAIWSVISFERVEARNLDYAKAAKLLAELESKGVPGLCIVTNEAADRVKTPE